MELLTVNETLCTQCGLCAEVCPVNIIGMGKAGPQMNYAPACIACGHCTAICPTAALDNEKAPVAGQLKVDNYPVLDAGTAEAFLRSRRSIRTYQPRKVSREEIGRLLNIARFAPTGCNSQGLSYIVIDHPEKLRSITEVTIGWLEEQVRNKVEWALPFAGIAEFYRKTGQDVVLRNAPHVVVAIAPQGHPMGHDNARYSLEYVELYATALKLGTCWAGFVEIAAGYGCQALTEIMEVPAGYSVVGAIMLGYPKYTYQRLPERNPLQVTWLSADKEVQYDE